MVEYYEWNGSVVVSKIPYLSQWTRKLSHRPILWYHFPFPHIKISRASERWKVGRLIQLQTSRESLMVVRLLMSAWRSVFFYSNQNSARQRNRYQIKDYSKHKYFYIFFLIFWLRTARTVPTLTQRCSLNAVQNGKDPILIAWRLIITTWGEADLMLA